MGNDPSGSVAPTRREYVKFGSAILSGSLIAGCSGDGGNGDGDPTATETETATEADTDAPTATTGSGGESPTPTEESYTVSLEPVGPVSFGAVPEEWVSYQYAYGDMGVALGQAEGYLGTNSPENYPDFFYDELPGVEFDASTLTDLGSSDREVFYELAPDVFLVDPNNARARFEWSRDELERLSERVAPFFGHFGRRYGYEYQTDYRRMGLYDLFGKVAEVFQERERYHRIEAIHDEVMTAVESNLPPEDERPTVGLLSGGSNVSDGALYLMEATADGYGRKQYRDLGVHDVLADVETDSPFYRTDMEGLLELDPDTIVVHWTVQLSDEEFGAKFVEPLEDDPVGGELTAVRNGRVFRGGTAEQGPIINLFQTELAAEQFYPDLVAGRDLFSREELARAVTGGE
jgi:iron complex transport system substrate-binding protein